MMRFLDVPEWFSANQNPTGNGSISRLFIPLVSKYRNSHGSVFCSGKIDSGGTVFQRIDPMPLMALEFGTSASSRRVPRTLTANRLITWSFRQTCGL